MPKLNEREIRFVEHYLVNPNGTKACRAAGYRGSDNVMAVQARRLLRKAHVVALLAERAKPASEARIASAESIRTFWTEMVNDQKADPKDRLKASELLGKTMGLFLEKRQIDGKLEINVRRGNDAAGALAPKEDEDG